jgi:hypothetical protein
MFVVSPQIAIPQIFGLIPQTQISKQKNRDRKFADLRFAELECGPPVFVDCTKTHLFIPGDPVTWILKPAYEYSTTVNR